MGLAFGEPLAPSGRISSGQTPSGQTPSGRTREDRHPVNRHPRPARRPIRPDAIRLAFCVLVHLCLVALLAATPAFAQQELLPAPRATPEQPAEEPASPTIDPGLDPQEDEEIAQRLRTIYSTVEGLQPIEVRVRAGVVVLTGEVSTQALREQAVRLARNVRGVAEIENRIAIAQDLEGRLTPALKRLEEGWNHVLRLLPVLLLGFAIMAGAIVVGRWLARRQSLYRRFSANDFIASLLAQVIQSIVVISGAALTLLLLDATGLVNTLLGAAGIIGLALGFALRDTVENYIASILLSLRRPFDPEDFVKIENHEGIVARLTSRATVLLTLDGNHVRIPNAAVYKGLIVNFTARPQRRFTFRLGVAPAEDLERAQRTAIDALASVDGVLSEPPPTALYESVGDSAVNMIVAGWMDQTHHDFLRVRSEAIRVVLTQMGAADVDLPEQTLRLRTVPETAEAPDATPATTPPRAGIATTPDDSLNRVIKQERTGKSDLLNQAGPHE